MFDSFVKYQDKMHGAFRRLQKTYDFNIVDGTRDVDDVTRELKKKISAALEGK